jgi:hypothetical protein
MEVVARSVASCAMGMDGSGSMDAESQSDVHGAMAQVWNLLQGRSRLSRIFGQCITQKDSRCRFYLWPKTNTIYLIMTLFCL